MLPGCVLGIFLFALFQIKHLLELLNSTTSKRGATNEELTNGLEHCGTFR